VRILHITDLHFGAHDSALAESLQHRVCDLKPDVIVCTGDLVDTAHQDYLEQAKEYLEQLANLSEKPSKVLVVPGNHDYRKHGFLWLDRAGKYIRVFSQAATDIFLEEENVWIYGFDSAHAGSFGGGGEIRKKDLAHFHTRYEELQHRHPLFGDAVKIVALHHHPLPVNWDHRWQDRWLTMTNSGAFLSAVLFRRIDLVVHGHEHVQARARLWSTLGGNDHELTVVSLGSTLRQLAQPNQNWFSVISIEANRANLDFYASRGDVFNTRAESLHVRLGSRSNDGTRRFEEWKKESGYFYRDTIFSATLSPEGDARIGVQYKGLEILDEACSRSVSHPVTISRVCGYLANIRARDAAGDLVIAQGGPGESQPKSFAGAVEFPRPVLAGNPIDYSCSWYALNSFARDQKEFYVMYAGKERLDRWEFVHFPISDPIERLSVAVRFPDAFFLPEPPSIRVMRMSSDPNPREWPMDSTIQNALELSGALRYYEPLGVACLEVARPIAGLSYGVQWRLPEAAISEGSVAQREILAFRRRWKRGRISDQKKPLLVLLTKIVEAARASFMDSWQGPIEASFLYFDGESKMIPLIAALFERRRPPKERKYRIRAYGDGIPGRTHKINRIHWWIAEEAVGTTDEPDHHLSLREGGDDYQVQLSFPICLGQSYDPNSSYPYGVLTFASDNLNCPLTRLGDEDAPDRDPRLEEFNQKVNNELREGIWEIFFE
jgi:predicted phosphodiesterase